MGTVLDTDEVVASGRTGRPNYTTEFKRRLAVEACEPSTSVAKLALRYGLNANMLFKWRRQYRAGQLGMQISNSQPVSYTHLDVYKRQQMDFDSENILHTQWLEQAWCYQGG